MHDFIDCAQKEKDIAKCKKKSKCFYMVASMFSKRSESYMI